MSNKYLCLHSATTKPVSYTHLDVYKRQLIHNCLGNRRLIICFICGMTDTLININYVYGEKHINCLK